MSILPAGLPAPDSENEHKLAKHYGAESGAVTDIYLPKWFAHNMPAIHVPLLMALSLSACGADPTQPDMSTRESFATTVLTTAASGSVEQLEKLAGEGQIDTRTRAQHLVDFARGWDAAPGDIKISHEWPEIVDVATKKDSSESIQFGYVWAHGR